MSELPPINEPNQPGWSAPPQQQYVGYTRPGPTYGNPDKLQALADGYYGLNWAFLATIALVLVSRIAAIGVAAAVHSVPLALVILYGLPMVIVGFISYPYNKKIGYGANWNDSSALIASVLMGINVLFCGIIGFIVMQTIAGKEIKKYGIKSGFFGMKKKDILAAIAQMRNNARVPQAPNVPPSAQR